MHVIPAARIAVSADPPADPVEWSVSNHPRGKPTARRVAVVAGGQGGCVSRVQLRRLGLSERVADLWIASGRLVVVHRGVFAVGHLPRTHEVRWWAAVLACGDGAAASHGTAAAAHGLLRPHPRVHVTTPAKRARLGVATHRAQVDVVFIDGLPCTTVARTLVDLAGCVPHRVLESAVRQAQVRGVLDVEAIGAVLLACPRPRGMRHLRAMLKDPVCLQPTRSAPERRALRALLGAGFAWPVVGGRVPGSDEDIVDFHWPGARLVLEVDGPTHDVSSVQRTRDRRRDDRLRRLGWRVVRVPADEAHTAPDHLERSLRHG